EYAPALPDDVESASHGTVVLTIRASHVANRSASTSIQQVTIVPEVTRHTINTGELTAMKTNVRSIVGILLTGAVLAPVAIVVGYGAPAGALRRPELEYLEVVNRVGPPGDPQLLFLLMAQYSNANRNGEGADFFAARLKQFEPRLSDAQKSLYLAAI